MSTYAQHLLLCRIASERGLRHPVRSETVNLTTPEVSRIIKSMQRGEDWFSSASLKPFGTS